MRILLLTDETESSRHLAGFLQEHGHPVQICQLASPEACWQEPGIQLILVDVHTPSWAELNLLPQLKALPQPPEVVLCVGYGEVAAARAALQAGAYAYLLRPLDLEELTLLLERIAREQQQRQEWQAAVEAEVSQTEAELQRVRAQLAQAVRREEPIFASPAMRQVMEQAWQYHYDRSVPVLIQGETGVGKEVIARLIHYGDTEHSLPLIDVNCAALTPTLFESELFGYEAGAYTGAAAKGKKGKLDAAYGGTLYLDEIGDMPLELQAKLLRVLEEKTYFRVGGLKKISMDVRLICSTNVDLTRQVEEGRFRRDLFYRLQVGHLYLPPLRERPEDILPLAELYLLRFAYQRGKLFRQISPEAAVWLQRYAWPGNVRELRNMMDRITLMHDALCVELAHLDMFTAGRNTTLAEGKNWLLPLGQASSAVPFVLPEQGFSLDEFIQEVVLAALAKHGGNKAQTARYLGISRRSLCYRLNQWEHAQEGT